MKIDFFNKPFRSGIIISAGWHPQTCLGVFSSQIVVNLIVLQGPDPPWRIVTLQ